MTNKGFFCILAMHLAAAILAVFILLSVSLSASFLMRDLFRAPESAGGIGRDPISGNGEREDPTAEPDASGGDTKNPEVELTPEELGPIDAFIEYIITGNEEKKSVFLAPGAIIPEGSAAPAPGRFGIIDIDYSVAEKKELEGSAFDAVKERYLKYGQEAVPERAETLELNAKVKTVIGQFTVCLSPVLIRIGESWYLDLTELGVG